ncbi:hypothetical protein IWX46DRAFT_335830 [Phyllosticta citricarpa]|uniref:Secreted protein n=1 Tax=Phyllosticta citricarpa TaxID=55181 RepID=A0ABR1LBP8_9PEZI
MCAKPSCHLPFAYLLACLLAYLPVGTAALLEMTHQPQKPNFLYPVLHRLVCTVRPDPISSRSISLTQVHAQLSSLAYPCRSRLHGHARTRYDPIRYDPIPRI